MRRYRFFGQVTVAGEPRSTEFLDGQRTVVMDIIKTLETDLKKLIQLYESLPEDKPVDDRSKEEIEENTEELYSLKNFSV
jgi:hypothetical protein